MENLKHNVDELLQREGIPACCIAVVNEHTVIWKQGFGCDLETEFHYFSGTKLYTAIGILKLAEQGKLNLNDYVAQYLPDWGEEYCDGIQIQHLLSHSSGLFDSPMKAFLSSNFQSTSKPSTLEALEKYNIKRARAPGKLSSYANVNYAILGQVIETVSGQTYSQYIKEQVLQPLGSNASFSFREATKLTKGCMGYWNSLAAKLVMDQMQYKLLFEGSETIPEHKRGAGLFSLANFDVDTEAAGGLLGKVEDFCPLLMELLRFGKTSNEESIGSPRCLSKGMLQLSVQKHFNGQIGLYSQGGAGFGWKIGDNFVNHEGGGPGFTTETRCYLDEGIGIVILMNKWSINNDECNTCHKICEIIRDAVGKTQKSIEEKN